MGVKEQVEAISRAMIDPLAVIGERRSFRFESAYISERAVYVPYLIGGCRIDRGLFTRSSLPDPLKDWIIQESYLDPILKLYDRGKGGDHAVRIILSSDDSELRQVFVYGATIPHADGILVVDILPHTWYTVGYEKPRDLSPQERASRLQLEAYLNEVGRYALAQNIVQFTGDLLRRNPVTTV